MGRLKTQQARSLWTKAIIQYICAIMLYTLLFGMFTLAVGLPVLATFGDWVADRTSSWSYVPVEAFEDMVQNKDVDVADMQIMEIPGGMIMDYYDWEAFGREEYWLSVLENYKDGMAQVGDSQTLALDVVEDEPMIAFRDLGTYNTLRNLKWLFVLAVYILGLLVVSLFMMRRPVRAIDDITDAVSSPGLPKGDPITLPARLKPVQSELELLQMRIVQNEMAARIADERKNELVTYLSHDIRTPMTSVMGYLELISEADGMPADRQQDYAQRAFKKANRLNGLVEELFEITRYNIQNIPIEREELDVQLLCEQIAEEFFPQAQEKRIEIDVEAGEGLSAFMDPSKMGRVLENVLKNALAHASEGSTIVLAAREDAGDGSEGSAGRIAISVSNQGKEISPEHLEHIFDRFYRGDAARGQQTGGAGLGLAIAKEIVEAHGGFIEVRSAQGETTFTIYVPR